MSDAPFDLPVTDALLSTTRAVRKRLDFDRPVPQSLLLECFAQAQQAPIASNQQRLRFLVVEEQSLKDALAEIYRQSAGSYFDSGRREGEGQQHRVMSSAAYLSDNLQRVPALVLPLGYGIPQHGGLAQNSSIFGSLYPAVWSFMLAARARGLGTTLTTITVSAHRAVNQLLDIPRGWEHFALLPTAYTVGTDFRPAKRPDVSDIVDFV